MAELYDFQRRAVDQLLNGKHILFAGMGCLAKGTPVRLADGSIKPVERVKSGDVLLSFDEKTGEVVPNAVSEVIRSCAQPKPMIELYYDGERITTTYDHYFYSEDGYAPLYQLAWGALEASQRVQLQLLCKQYGQDCDDNLFWRKRSWDNEACQEQQMGSPKDNNGREKCSSPSSYCGNLVEKPVKVTMREPYQLQSSRQQGRELGVLFKEVQCVSWLSCGEHKETDDKERQKSINQRRTKGDQRLLSGIYARDNQQPRKKETLRKTLCKVSNSRETTNTKVRNWSIKIKVPAPYYSIRMCQAPYTYCIGRKHNYLVHNTGKNPTSMVWAAEKCEATGKDKILVITTASKAKTSDHLNDLDTFCPLFSKSLSSFSVLSWHKLAEWVRQNWKGLDEWVVVADEVQRSKGYTTGMGKAFLKIAKRNPDWAGFTGTPGDSWENFITYFVATNKVRNKTGFMAEFANVQTYKGYPEIVGWRNEDKLRRMWHDISYAPDTSIVAQQLPKEQYHTLYYSKPTAYSKTLKTRLNSNGEFLDTAGALVAELRRHCFTKDKQQWIADYVDSLESGCVFFYNYIATGDKLEEIITKALGKSGKVWRIDGKHHEIPTAETIGKKDMVICQWQSGSEALNLQFLHYWVGVELCYSNSVLQQSMGRIRRIGQEHPMTFTRLVTKDTIEEDIVDCLREKKEFSEKNWCESKITKEDNGI